MSTSDVSTDTKLAIQSSNHIDGKRNILLLFVLIGTLLIAPFLPITELAMISGVSVTVIDCVRLGGMISLGWLSYAITPHAIHTKQHFNFAPVYEVARVFLCIFITLIPLNYALSGGNVFASLLKMNMGISPQRLYFWLSGLFSGFLDNTPTYLVFFKLAGGNMVELTTTQKPILVAISLGSVLMGALTYIGNAPNFMVLSIAKQHGIKMPSFLGYMVWSFIILIPIFIMVSYLWL
jgi:Na+/H+ antiporter NhaD/arsenite permease-like protein